MEAIAGSLFGVLRGMRHACEPDHLAAGVALMLLLLGTRAVAKALPEGRLPSGNGVGRPCHGYPP